MVERPWVQARLQVSGGMKFRIPPCRAQGICPFPPAASPPSLHQEPGVGGCFPKVTCSLHPQINHRRVSSWASPTSCLLLRKGPWWFHVHCTSVTILFVYMSVNSGSMLSILVTLNSGALPRYGCVLMTQIYLFAFRGFPQLIVWF